MSYTNPYFIFYCHCTVLVLYSTLQGNTWKKHWAKTEDYKIRQQGKKKKKEINSCLMKVPNSNSLVLRLTITFLYDNIIKKVLWMCFFCNEVCSAWRKKETLTRKKLQSQGFHMTAVLSSDYTGHGSYTQLNRPPEIEEWQIKSNGFTIICFEIGEVYCNPLQFNGSPQRSW